MKMFIQAIRQIPLLALLWVVAGCKTTDLAKDGSLASIVINGHSTGEIQNAIVQVFESNGFQQMGALTFEKQGTRQDTLKFGGLDSGPVWIRMKVHVSPRSNNQHVLGCDAYVVQNHGDRFLETETRLKYSKSDECLDLLNKIKAQLSAPASELK